MTRPPRCTVPGVTHHVFQRGNNRTTMFYTEGDYLLFRDCLLAAIRRHPCRIHAYVLMPNHVHVLITADVDAAIGRVMQHVGTRYVRHFNSRHGRTGTLWEGRYQARIVEPELYLLGCHRYIELNPVDAHLTADPRDYRWSSYRANAFGARDPLITPHDVYEGLATDSVRRRQEIGRAHV